MVDAQTQPVKVTGCHPRHLQPYEPPPQYAVWPEVWYVWWSRAGTEARMAPRTVELVPKYSKPHEPTRPAATHADLREDARATHNTIPRIKESRRHPHPRRNPMVRRSRPRQRVDETTHAPRNVRYLLPRPAIGGHSRVHGTTHQVAVLVEEVVIAVRQNGVS